MESKHKERMVMPDVLKIVATIYAIWIHHKDSTNPDFFNQCVLLYAIFFALAFFVSIYLFAKTKDKGYLLPKRLFIVVSPVLFMVSMIWLKTLAVSIFVFVTGFVMSINANDENTKYKNWYKRENIIPRITRFYLPYITVFFIATICKIIFYDASYTPWVLIKRFFFGDFKPGGYYVTILFQLVLVFPFAFRMVKKYDLKAVGAVFLFSLVYDILCTMLSVNSNVYKCLVFRFFTHIFLGVYGAIGKRRTSKRVNVSLLIMGLIYVIPCVSTRQYVPKLFFGWQETSFLTALFVYPVAMLLIEAFKDARYTDSRFSKTALLFANSTYHIFLFQAMYHLIVGYKMNEYLDCITISLPINLFSCIVFGIMFYKISNNTEKKIITSLKRRLRA